MPEADLLVEDNSRSTAENLKFSKKIMELRSEGRFRCVFVSNGYHLLRASMIARSQGCAPAEWARVPPLITCPTPCCGSTSR